MVTGGVASVDKWVCNLTLIDLQDLARLLDKPIEEIFSGQSKAKHAKSGGPDLGLVPPPPPGPEAPKAASQHHANDQPRWESQLQNQKVA